MSDEKTAKNRERGVLVLRIMLLPGRDALSRRHYNIVIMIVNSVHAIGFLFAPEERHGEDEKKKKPNGAAIILAKTREIKCRRSFSPLIADALPTGHV